jgi:hypothetical protein
MQEIIVASFTLTGSSLATYLSHREKKSKGCILWVQNKGERKRLLLEHNDRNGGGKLHPKWMEMDLLWCCHPQVLTPNQRAKHLAPDWEGKVRVRWEEETNSIHLVLKDYDDIRKKPKYSNPPPLRRQSCSAALQR